MCSCNAFLKPKEGNISRILWPGDSEAPERSSKKDSDEVLNFDLYANWF